jgi:DNA-binding transcriptional regulator YdaS (Cro superfamily)
MHPLADYLSRNHIKLKDFARRLKVTPSRVSQICGGELPSLELAVAIEAATSGAVRPADMMQSGEKPRARRQA